MDSLGIIAGSGDLPVILANAARASGVSRVVAAAFDGETDPDFAKFVDDIEWMKLGQLNKLIEAFKSRGVSRAAMAGTIAPSNLFKDIRLDFRMMAIAARLKVRNADTIFGAIADEMHKDGVEIIDARPLLGDAVPVAGCLTKHKPDSDEREAIEFGSRIAKEVSRLDIGQTVVVKKGTVLAVEGFEGTDQCIRRGGTLAGDKGGAVVVKVSKPDHDFRFDIPVIGMRTLESCAAGKIAVLAIEAGRSLLLRRPELLAAAEKQKLCIVAVNGS